MSPFGSTDNNHTEERWSTEGRLREWRGITMVSMMTREDDITYPSTTASKLFPETTHFSFLYKAFPSLFEVLGIHTCHSLAISNFMFWRTRAVYM